MLSHPLSHAAVKREHGSSKIRGRDQRKVALLGCELQSGTTRSKGYYKNPPHHAVYCFGQFILRRAPRCKSPRQVFRLRVDESQATVTSTDCWYHETWVPEWRQTYRYTQFQSVQSSSESLKTLSIGSLKTAYLSQCPSEVNTVCVKPHSSVTSTTPLASIAKAS